MPTRTRSKTPASAYTIAVELHGLAASCEAFPDAVVDEALPKIGARMKALALEEAARVTGGDGRLSRFNKGKGIKLSAGYDVVAPGVVRLTPRPLGPWTLVESGSARSYWFEPRRGKALTKKGARKKGARPIRLRNGAVHWYVRHGPVRGKRAWSQVKFNIAEALPDLVHAAVVDAWVAVRKAA